MVNHYSYVLPALLLVFGVESVFLRTQPHLQPASINKLSLPLAKILNTGDENVVYSPLSLTTAMGIVREGATGSTLDKINQFFGEDLSSVIAKVSTAASQANSTKLHSVNVVVHNRDLALKDGFKSRMNSKYLASAKSFDGAKPEEAVQFVNEYVSNSTEKLIPKIISKIEPGTSVILVNAVFFDAKWLTPFESDFKAIFHGTKGDQQVTYLMRHDNFGYAHSAELHAQAIELKYQDQYSMIVVMPDSNSTLTELVNALTEKSFNHLYLSMTPKKIKLELPKFEIEEKLDIIQELTRVGLGELFLPGADYSNMADGLQISSGVHKTVVKINEQGTQAAASSVVTFSREALADDYFVIHFDRPFMFVIRDRVTNSDLFTGLVKNVN